MERGTFQDSAAKLFNVLPANIRNCSDFKVCCREVNVYLLNNICKQFVNCIQGCITITNPYNIFIFYTKSFYSSIFLLFILQISIQFLLFVVYYSFSFFILQFLTGEEPLGGYTVNSSRSAERSEFIISSRAVCEPRVGPSKLESRNFHLYLYISDGVRHDVIQQ